MPILACARWHDGLSFRKQALRLRLVRVARVAGCCQNNCAAQQRYLRRLAQSATPAAAEDKFCQRSSTCEQHPTAPKREKRQKMHVFCWMLQLFVLLLGQAIRRKDGFVVFADQKILVKFLTQAKHKFVPRRRPTFDVRDFKLVSTLRTWAFCAYSVRFTRAFWL